MRAVYRTIFSLAAVAVLAFCLPVATGAKNIVKTTEGGQVSAVYFPAVQLKHWKDSTQQERFAFLAGFVSMLELERSWQGKESLPVTQSIVGTWVRGLSGATLKNMDDAVNKYIAAHPQNLDKSVLEVLGKIYVRPKMTKDEQRLAADRYEKIKVDFVP
ncbi:hypothetical protein LJC26_00695 [Desulfovibrio sp. OttesenSCG-928-O18]|nr:hypothetical protein [Desulfovibrio sp. OttesenSCG-928-O18]